MAMPKKGTRKIVIDGTTYKYRIRSELGCCILTVEMSHNQYESTTIEESITPAVVETFIKSKL